MDIKKHPLIQMDAYYFPINFALFANANEIMEL